MPGNSHSTATAQIAHAADAHANVTTAQAEYTARAHVHVALVL